ncbi:MAG: type 4b pilus protein PilO2 [Alphaproteobacteria bacterium]|nr:type 4b pilus protein PilO2 [Alphaproteobacteria bacterium]
MPLQVITIERKKYAVGLFWQPLAAGQNPRNFAATLSKQIPGTVKFYAEFKSMVGVGGRALGHRRGMKIAAVEVINSFSEYNSFLAAFFVPQGFWIVAVRNNIIIFDQLFSNENDAKREYANLSELPDWGIMVAPGYWTIPRAVEKPLKDIVAGNSKVSLTPIGSVSGNIISLLVFAAFAFGVWYFFHEPIAKLIAPKPQKANISPEVLEEYKRKLEAKNARVAAPEPVRIAMPYDDLPDAELRADQCWRGIAYVMQQIPGWVQTGAECDGLTARANLRRTYGTVAGMHESARLMMNNVFITENTDSDAVISVTLPKLPSQPQTPQFLVENIVYSVNTLFQTIGASANVRPVIETVRQGIATQDISVVTVNASSKLKPLEFIEIFEGISPLYLKAVKWDARTRVWNYEVRIYAK